MADPVPSYQTGDDQGPSIIAANVTVAVLATIGVILRFIARKVQRIGWGADDYLILGALPFGWGMAIATIVAVHFGLGRHVNAVAAEPGNLIKEGQTYFATELIWAPGISLIKISLLLLYVRIFGRQKYFRYIAYVLGTFTVAWMITVEFVNALQCRPVQLIWDKSGDVSGTCINALLWFVIGSSLNVATDFIILILPIPSIAKLQLSGFQKVSLIGIFLLGSLTCIISLVRLITIVQQLQDFNVDVTWASGPISIWSTAEPCLGILAACLPTLRPLFTRAVNKFSTRGASGGVSGASGGRPGGSWGHKGSNTPNSFKLGNVSSGGNSSKSKALGGGVREMRSEYSTQASRHDTEDLQRLRDPREMEYGGGGFGNNGGSGGGRHYHGGLAGGEGGSLGGVSTDIGTHDVGERKVPFDAIGVATTWSREESRR